MYLHILISSYRLVFYHIILEKMLHSPYQPLKTAKTHHTPLSPETITSYGFIFSIQTQTVRVGEPAEPSLPVASTSLPLFIKNIIIKCFHAPTFNLSKM